MVEVGGNSDIRQRVVDLVAQSIDAIIDRWGRRMRELFADDPVVSGIPAEDFAAGTREMLSLMLAYMADPSDTRCFTRVEELTQRAYRAGLAGDRVNHWWIALERVVDEVLEEHLGGEPKAWLEAHYCIEEAIDPLRLKVNQVYHETSQGELLESETRHRALLRNASDAILTLDPVTGKLVAANLRALRLTGYSHEELAGMRFPELRPPEDREAAEAEIGRLVSDRVLALQDIELQRKDGSRVPVDVSANLIEAGDNVVCQAIVRDISERKELERRRLEYEAELERRVEERTAELRWMTSFSESVIQSMPTPMLVLDSDLTVLRADQTYLEQQGISQEEAQGTSIHDLFAEDLLEGTGLLDALRSVLETGQPVQLDNVRHTSEDHEEKILNFRIRCVDSETSRDLILLWDDVTTAAKRTSGLSLLYQIGQAVQGALELDRLLYAILTCVTAGPTAGLGFNRAFLLLPDPETGVMKGRLGVGPESAEDAHRIWSAMATGDYSLEAFLAAYDDIDPETMPLSQVAAGMELPHEGPCATAQALAEKRAILVRKGEGETRFPGCHDILGSSEFVVVPLIARDQAVGVILADNLYSGHRIKEEDIWLLEMFAAQAGGAIAAAQTYQALQDNLAALEKAYEELRNTQEQLVRKERLAAVGEVAAKVAHEIRNPLTTIGGFARVMARDPSDRPRIQQSANIIVEEVDRLEHILGNLLSFTRPSSPVFQPTDVNAAVQETCALLADDYDGELRRLELDLEPVPPVLADQRQLKQAFLNLAKNAAQAMPEGGTLTIRSRCRDGEVWVQFIDTGKGIPEDVQEEIFEPFFTTRTVGSGIGLAVTRQIVDEHGGRLELESTWGQGSIFTTVLAAHQPGGPDARPATSRRQEASST
ncbi:MAG: PAS domain S-box protein [Armatimonadota bacterium]